MKFLSNIIDLFKKTAREWSEDDASQLAAAMAYYTIFSLVPLLVIAIGLASLLYTRKTAETQVFDQVNRLIGPQAAKFISSLVSGAQNPSGGLAATAIAIGTLVFGALGAFSNLQLALNKIWEANVKKPRGLIASVKDILFNRFMSFVMVLLIGALLVASLVLSALISTLRSYLGPYISFPDRFIQATHFGVSLVLLTVFFAMIFKLLPDVEVAWSDVWLGAVVTSLLFTLGDFAIGFYLGISTTSSTFGAAGSLVVLLIWIYYSAQILFFGAEFTQVYANRFGSRMVPEAEARLEERRSGGQPSNERRADERRTEERRDVT